MKFLGTLIPLLIAIFVIVTFWRLFVKAGYAGWKSLIPVYGQYLMMKLAFGEKCILPFIGLFIPFVNFIVLIVFNIKLAKAFGKEALFGILLILLPIIGYPMLAFGDSQYVGLTDQSTNQTETKTTYSEINEETNKEIKDSFDEVENRTE